MATKSTRISFALIALLAILPATASAGADWFIDLDLSAGVDDNVTRAQSDIDIEHDTFISISGGGGYNKFLNPNSTLVLRGDVTAEQFFDFEGLSSITGRASAQYNHQFGKGFSAPWVSVNASFAVAEFDSSLRDSDTAEIFSLVGKQFTDKVTGRMEVGYKNRRSDGASFDLANAHVLLNIDYTLAKKQTLYLVYRTQFGDVVSSAASTSPGFLQLINVATAFDNTDDVFTDKITYRLDATTNIITLGYNLALSLRQSIDVSARYLDATSDDDSNVYYQDLLVRVSYLHRFDFED